MKVIKCLAGICLLVFRPDFLLAQGISVGSVEQQISTAWTWAESILTIFLFFSIMRSGLIFYDRIKRSEAETKGDTLDDALILWLKGTVFLIIALSIVNSLKIALNSALAQTTSAWTWAQHIIIAFFSIALLLSIIKVYSKQDPNNPGEFKKALNRFGVSLIFLIISFGVVSGYKAIFAARPVNITSTGYDIEGESNIMGIFTAAFTTAVAKSGVANAFFMATSSLAILFLLIDIIRKYSAVTIGDKELSIWEFAKPMVIVFLVAAWQYIYAGLEDGFGEIETLFSALVSKNSNGQGLIDIVVKINSQGLFKSVLTMDFVSLSAGLLGYLLLFVNWILDAVVSLYVNVNVLLLSILAPIALLLTFWQETGSSIIVWLKKYILFKLFILLIIAINYIGTTFLIALDANMNVTVLESLGNSLTGVGGLTATLSLAAFIVLKIIFLLVGYGFLSSLIKESGSNVGSVVGSIVSAGMKAGKIGIGSPG